ncbi:hypothetical protein [Malikia spinosa]|nr:hypothetical protein [Malikia spinosa]
MPSTSKHLRIAAALTICLSDQYATSATPSVDISNIRKSVIGELVSGCVAAVIAPAVRSYMQRAEQDGEPFSSEFEARAEMTGSAKWKSEMEPIIRSSCECLMKQEIDDIKNSQSTDDIENIVLILSKRHVGSMNIEAEEEKLKHCFKHVFDR